MKIEFKEISLPSIDYLTSQKYPSKGFFYVTQGDIDKKDLVFNTGDVVWLLLDNVSIPNIESYFEESAIEDSPKSNGLVSEELFLKAMSLMVNKDESYKQ